MFDIESKVFTIAKSRDEYKEFFKNIFDYTTKSRK